MSLASQILKIFYPHMRILGNEIFASEDDFLHAHAHHLNKIGWFISQGKPIQFVLPAFPAKSSNINKVMAPYPDLGERMSLRFLNEICIAIGNLYQPSAQIIICSDGRVFNDLVLVSDDRVTLYANEIRSIIQNDNLSHLSTFDLDDYFSCDAHEQMRSNLCDLYGESVSLLRERIANHPAERGLFNGIHRFIFEDRIAAERLMSRNQVRKISKEITYEVIKRSNAWSRLLADQFPSAVRLSIHPQVPNSHKVGIMLLKSGDNWATPWHRVVLFDGEQYTLIKKNEAELMNAKPIFHHQKFSHFISKDLI